MHHFCTLFERIVLSALTRSASKLPWLYVPASIVSMHAFDRDTISLVLPSVHKLFLLPTYLVPAHMALVLLRVVRT